MRQKLLHGLKEKKINSYATIKTTDWTVVINAPKDEFMGTVASLRLSLLTIGTVIFLTAFITAYLVARAMVKSIQTASFALQNITQSEGD
ncbi:MAG: hypothetical protein ACTTJ7_06000 [Treponema sp.]